MGGRGSSDAEQLWSQIGLEQLRTALNRMHRLEQDFEHALRALPPCSQCARSQLLEQIRATGSRLGSEVVSVAALAETLKQAVAAAEAAQTQLAAHAPEPCSCEGGPCACHD